VGHWPKCTTYEPPITKVGKYHDIFENIKISKISKVSYFYIYDIFDIFDTFQKMKISNNYITIQYNTMN